MAVSSYLRNSICALFTSLILSGSISNAQDRITGKNLANTYCARCHQTGLTGNSPDGNAPPFWKLGETLPIDTIDETLLLQLSPEHSAMPVIKLTPKQARSLMLWISWVQPTAHGERLVNHYCLPCHATGQEDESRHPEATPFRDVSIFTSMKSLREKFAGGIETNHPDMPRFGADDEVLKRILGHIEAQQKAN